MKYISNSRKAYLVKRQLRIEKLRREKCFLRKSRQVRYCRSITRQNETYNIIHMPSRITIGNEYYRNKLIICLRQIGRTVAIEKKNVLLDFSNTHHTIADGMLLLYAEISRLRAKYGHYIKLRCRLPVGSFKKKGIPVNANAEKVAQVLKHIGILEMLQNKAPIVPNREDVIHWRVASGIKSEGEKTEPVLKVVDLLLGKKVSRKFYTGLTEAMTNSHHHAYEGIREDGLGFKDEYGWWLFLQVRGNTLSILICDLGIGIPRSLPKTNKYWLLDQLKQMSRHRDSTAIEYATQKGSTSTDMKNRGKGLKKMVGLIKEIPGASLAIYSNKGAYLLDENHKRFLGATRKDYESSILGTLVYWSVDFDKGVLSEAN